MTSKSAPTSPARAPPLEPNSAPLVETHGGPETGMADLHIGAIANSLFNNDSLSSNGAQTASSAAADSAARAAWDNSKVWSETLREHRPSVTAAAHANSVLSPTSSYYQTFDGTKSGTSSSNMEAGLEEGLLEDLERLDCWVRGLSEPERNVAILNMVKFAGRSVRTDDLRWAVTHFCTTDNGAVTGNERFKLVPKKSFFAHTEHRRFNVQLTDAVHAAQRHHLEEKKTSTRPHSPSHPASTSSLHSHHHHHHHHQNPYGMSRRGSLDFLRNEDTLNAPGSSDALLAEAASQHHRHLGSTQSSVAITQNDERISTETNKHRSSNNHTATDNSNNVQRHHVDYRRASIGGTNVVSNNNNNNSSSSHNSAAIAQPYRMNNVGGHVNSSMSNNSTINNALHLPSAVESGAAITQNWAFSRRGSAISDLSNVDHGAAAASANASANAHSSSNSKGPPGLGGNAQGQIWGNNNSTATNNNGGGTNVSQQQQQHGSSSSPSSSSQQQPQQHGAMVTSPVIRRSSYITATPTSANHNWSANTNTKSVGFAADPLVVGHSSTAAPTPTHFDYAPQDLSSSQRRSRSISGQGGFGTTERDFMRRPSLPIGLMSPLPAYAPHPEDSDETGSDTDDRHKSYASPPPQNARPQSMQARQSSVSYASTAQQQQHYASVAAAAVPNVPSQHHAPRQMYAHAAQSHHHHHHPPNQYQHSHPNQQRYQHSNSHTSNVGAPQAQRSRSPSADPNKPEQPIDFALLQADVPAWLRSLRLHKYTQTFENMSWRNMIALDEAALERLGIAAQGARRKMLKVFAQIKDEAIQRNIRL